MPFPSLSSSCKAPGHSIADIKRPFVGREINALFDIIDLPTDLFGFAAYSFNCGGLK